MKVIYLLKKHRIVGFIDSTNLLSVHHLTDPFQCTCDITVNKTIKNKQKKLYPHESYILVWGREEDGGKINNMYIGEKIVH